MKNGLLTQKDFVDAAKLLEKKGHTKDTYGFGPYCGAGALGQVAVKNPYGLSNLMFPERVMEVLKIKTFGGFANGEYAITRFNDQADTTKEDVQTLLLLLGEAASYEQKAA